MSNQAEPNWYPDPYGQSEKRWWDGAKWTEHVHPPISENPQSNQEYAQQPSQVSQSSQVEQNNQTATQNNQQPVEYAQYNQSEQPSNQINAKQNTKKRKKLAVIASITAGAVVLSSTVTIFVLASINNNSSESANSAVAANYVNNGYEYLSPEEFKASENGESLPYYVEMEQVEGVDDREAFKMFADKELTLPIDNSVLRNYGDKKVEIAPLSSGAEAQPADVDAGVQDFSNLENLSEEELDEMLEGIEDYDDLEDSGLSEGLRLPIAFAYEEDLWSVFETYYVVRYYDEAGKKLETPQVLQLVPKLENRFDPVVPQFSQGQEPGSIKVSWTAPKGATKDTEYLILKTTFGSDVMEGIVTYEWVELVIGKTQWDSSKLDAIVEKVSDRQNYSMSIFSGSSSDEQAYASDDAWKSRKGNDAFFAVVAMGDGTEKDDEKIKLSPIKLVKADQSIRSAPLEFAFWQTARTFPETITNLSEHPTWVPVVTLDGTTRKMPIRMDPASLESISYGTSSALKIWYNVEGTKLRQNIIILPPAGVAASAWAENIKTQVDGFNAKVAQEAPLIGSSAPFPDARDEQIDINEYRKLKAVKDTPKIDYPIFGSHPMVEHLAANIMNNEKSIDLSKWKKDASAPEAYSAMSEIYYQNPYIDMKMKEYVLDGDKMYVSYYEGEQAKTAQKRIDETKTSITKVIKEIIKEGASDSEKVDAINSWIIKNVEYDHESFKKHENGEYTSEFDMIAWTPYGAFEGGKVVCAGYSDLFSLMARESGLETVQVAGDVINLGPHAWNKVKVDGKWKAIDTTWNDSEPVNKYYLIDDSEFTEGATRTDDARWIALGKESYATS